MCLQADQFPHGSKAHGQTDRPCKYLSPSLIKMTVLTLSAEPNMNKLQYKAANLPQIGAEVDKAIFVGKVGFEFM